MHGGKGYFGTSVGFMLIFFCVCFHKDLSRSGSLFESRLDRLGHVVGLFLDIHYTPIFAPGDFGRYVWDLNWACWLLLLLLLLLLLFVIIRVGWICTFKTYV